MTVLRSITGNILRNQADHILRPRDPIYANSKLGYLYPWDTASDARGFVAGWDLPDDTDWTTLFATAGGVTVAGGHLKQDGTVFWNSPNTGADNSYNFFGRGSGSRSATTGLFTSIGQVGFYWSAQDFGGGLAREWAVLYNSTSISSGAVSYKFGHSIRLIKNDSTDPGYVDIDGLRYLTVKIGSQVWLAENLKAIRFANGDPITEVTDNAAWTASDGIIKYCAYNNDAGNV